MPQRPQPVGPSIARRRSTVRRAASGASHIRASMPPLGHDLELGDLAGRATLPSVRLKPMREVLESAGLAIITAWVVPS